MDRGAFATTTFGTPSYLLQNYHLGILVTHKYFPLRQTPHLLSLHFSLPCQSLVEVVLTTPLDLRADLLGSP